MFAQKRIMGKYDQQICDLLKKGAKTDRELANIVLGMGKHQSPINIACRKLKEKGLIDRVGTPIMNVLLKDEIPLNIPHPTKQTKQGLSEDETKEIIRKDLENKGWTIDFFAPGMKPGTDIIARKDNQRWFIEVKGCGSLNPMRVNYFLSVLGEILQRMDDPAAKYSIAFPDMEQYRKLWAKLPLLAKERTKIGIIFVKDESTIDYTE